MLITYNTGNSEASELEGITCYLETQTARVSETPFEIDFCYCGFDCDSTLRVFSGATDREKDYFTLYYKTEDETGTINYFIGDTELVDGIHGTALENGFTVDWTNISNVIGYGVYCLRIEVTEFGETKEFKRGNFTLLPFSLEEAQNTVRFKTKLNGDIESDFNYSNENVPFEIRLPASFIISDRKDDFEGFLDYNNDDNKSHIRWYYEYECGVMLNNHNLLRLLLDRYLAGNEIQIDSYSVFKPKNKQTFKYISTEIEDIPNTRYFKLNMKFEDFNKSNIKHPYLG